MPRLQIQPLYKDAGVMMQPQYGKNQYQMIDPQQQQPQTCHQPPMRNNVNFGSENIIIDSMLQNQRPTAPTLLYTIGDQTYGLPVKYVNVKSDFHIGTMFGRMHIVFTNNTPNKVSGTFAFPSEGTVTDADIKIGDGRFVGTTYVEKSNAQKLLSGGRNRGSDVTDNPNDRFIPDLFRCPINRINPGEDVIIEISFMQSVEYFENRYQFTLPLTFSPEILPSGVNYSQVVFIEAHIHCLTANIQYGSGSHSMMLQSHMNNTTSLVAAPLPQNQSSVDFHFAYTVENQVVTSMTIVTPPEQDSYDTRQSFVNFVNPPKSTKSCAPSRSTRDILFLMDRALSTGLEALHDGDRFGIIGFDHEASYLNYMANSRKQAYNHMAKELAKEFIHLAHSEMTKILLVSEENNHDTSNLQGAYKGVISKLLESGSFQYRKWADTKSARCSEGKNHDTSNLQGACKDVRWMAPEAILNQEYSAFNMKAARYSEGENQDHALNHEAINTHPHSCAHNTNEKEELGSEKKGREVLPNSQMLLFTVQEKVLSFFLDHYIALTLTMLSLILTNTLPSNSVETLYQNFAILSFFIVLLTLKRNKILEARVDTLEGKPSLQAENVFADGGRQQVVVPIWVYEGDLERVDEILKRASHHATLEFKPQSMPPNDDLKSFDFAAWVKNSISKNTRAKSIQSDSKEVFGVDKETYESLDVIPEIPL